MLYNICAAGRPLQRPPKEGKSRREEAVSDSFLPAMNTSGIAGGGYIQNYCCLPRGLLFIAGPADEIGKGRLLAVHEDSHTIDFGCNPYQPHEGGIQHHERHQNLP